MRAPDLLLSLMAQRVVRGDGALAARLAGEGSLVRLTPGQVLLQQEEDGSAIYFVVQGSVRILVNGREVARRVAGETVGEMAAIDPRALRAATVLVHEAGYALRLTEPSIAVVGDLFPSLWRHLAAEMAERLRESNRLIRSPNPRPVLMLRDPDPTRRERLTENLGAVGVLTQLWPEDAPPERWHALVSDVDFSLLVARAEPGTCDHWAGFCAGMLGRGRAFVVSERALPGTWPCCELLLWDPTDDPEMSHIVGALGAAVADLGSR